MQGWGVRPGDWQIGATLQHEVLPRVSMEVGYIRRWLQNFTVTDNRAQAATDFGPFSVTAPLDPRLPGGGGYVVSGLFNANPNVSALTDNYRTYAPDYGNQYSDLQRPGNERERAATQRHPAAGGLEHGIAGDRRLRGPGEAAGDRRSSDRRPESLLSQRPGHHHQGHGRRLVHDPEDRRAAQRDLPEQPRRAARGELHRVQRASCRAALGRPLSATSTNVTVNLLTPGRRLGRAGQSARLPCRQGPALRPAAGDHLGRPVQRAELRRDPDLQPGLQPDRELAGADVGVDGAQRRRSPCSGTSRTDHTVDVISGACPRFSRCW